MLLGSQIILNVIGKPNHAKCFFGNQIMLNVIEKPNHDKYFPTVKRQDIVDTITMIFRL